MTRFLWLVPICLLAACSSGGTKHDLGKVSTGARTGMTELELNQAIGVPTRIDMVDGMRELRYDGVDGGRVIVVVKGNIVVDVRRE